MNDTFYRNFPGLQFEKWKEKTPDGFKFFPKLGQEISHGKRLKDVEEVVNSYIENFSNLEEKLGTIFVQLNSNFSPKNFEVLKYFAESWPKNIPLAIEARHKDWFAFKKKSQKLSQLLEDYNIANVLVDTAGRRDMVHNRLTNNEAFIRFVGANHPLDYNRLDEWVLKLREWVNAGLENVHFFIHQNAEKESHLLATHFIKNINAEFGLDIKISNQ